MIHDAANTQDARQQSRMRLPMPTLTACAFACLALVSVVGLQAPAVSVGLRWKPGPRTRTLSRIEIEPIDGFDFPPLTITNSGLGARAAWAIGTLIVIGLLIWLARYIRHRTRRAPLMNVARTGADNAVVTEAGAKILQSGLAAAIEILSTERDLGNAVVQAWQGLEDAAAAAGLHRRAAETASEFTARILYRSQRSSEPIAVLLSLYQRVRFGEHSPSEAEITIARTSLEALMRLWEADFPKRRPAKVIR